MKKVFIVLASSTTYHTTNITANASRKRNPETPVKNDGSISLCFNATHRQISTDAISTTSTNVALKAIGVERFKIHHFAAKSPTPLSAKTNTMH